MGNSEFYASIRQNPAYTGEETIPNVRARAPYRIRHRKAFLWLILTIFVMCLVHLGLGIFISCVVDPSHVYYSPVYQETYSTGSLISRV